MVVITCSVGVADDFGESRIVITGVDGPVTAFTVVDGFLGLEIASMNVQVTS